MDACQIAIRPYAPADAHEWVRCRVWAFLRSAYFDDVVTSKPTYDDAPRVELVATADERIVGLIDVVLYADGLATIETIAVAPEVSRSGVGTALLEGALARLPANVTVLDAWTREDDEANGWYKANGFDETYRYLHVYADQQELETAMVTALHGMRPIQGWFHTDIKNETALRQLFKRIYSCRRYERSISRVR